MDISVKSTINDVISVLTAYAESGDVSLDGTSYDGYSIKYAILPNADGIAVFGIEQSAELKAQQAEEQVRDRDKQIRDFKEQVNKLTTESESLASQLDEAKASVESLTSQLTSAQSLVDKYKAIASKFGLASDEE